MIQNVFKLTASTSWQIIANFDANLGRNATSAEGFEVYCDSEIEVEFGYGTASTEPSVVSFALQPKIPVKFLEDRKAAGVLWCRAASGSPDVVLEV